MFGRLEAAQKLLLNDMKDEFDSLTDEDPENDYKKYMKMTEIFMHTGDDLNALSAWSLFDLCELRKKYDAKSTKEDEEAEVQIIAADGRAKDTNEGEKAEKNVNDSDQEAQDSGENRIAEKSHNDEEVENTDADAEAKEMKEYDETKYAEESAERPTQSETPSLKPGLSSNGDDTGFSCDGRCNKPLTWASSL